MATLLGYAASDVEQFSVKLSTPNLNTIAMAYPKVEVPKYSRASLLAGIVHFGVGNFHRSHQAVFLSELFNMGQGNCCGRKRSRLKIKDSKKIECRTLKVLMEVNALKWLKWRLNSNPCTVFGLIVTALIRRHANGTDPFTVLSCDNITKNGEMARNACVGTARALGYQEFADWIAENVAFPNGMVDRITPMTGDIERTTCQQNHGIEDGWPVFCENYKHWVLEDNFPAGRPTLEKVGVQFVPDVTPYEIMKLRLLNGGHAAIAYPAALLGLKFAHKAMQNNLISAYLRKLQTDEILPTVPPVEGIDLHDYCKLIQQRFSNPKIEDTIQRLCYDGTNRQPKFIVPTIEQRIKSGKSINGLALVSALWCLYCLGTDENGTPIAPNDPAWAQLNATAKMARDNDDPSIWLSMKHIYGNLVAESDAFRQQFAKTLRHLWEFGTESALKRYLGE